MAKKAIKKAGAPPAPTKKLQDSAASHPTYFQMIQEAISALHERGGSSPYAISKYMEKKYKGSLPGNFRKLLGGQLRNLTAKGKLVKVKASFKLSPSEKQVSKKNEKVATPKVAVGKTKARNVAVVKKPVVLGKRKADFASMKVASPASKKSKRAAPKSIKFPASKKGKKISS